MSVATHTRDAGDEYQSFPMSATASFTTARVPSSSSSSYSTFWSPHGTPNQAALPNLYYQPAFIPCSIPPELCPLEGEICRSECWDSTMCDDHCPVNCEDDSEDCTGTCSNLCDMAAAPCGNGCNDASCSESNQKVSSTDSPHSPFSLIAITPS